MNSKECKKYLAAFADGELDVDQNLRLLEYMKMDPNATARVTHQQQLRDSVCRCMSADCSSMPDALKQSVIQMFESPTQESVDENAVIARIPPYQVTAWLSSIAALVAITLSLMLYLNQPHTNPSFANSPVAAAQHMPGFNIYAAASMLPTAQVNRFVNQHVSCAEQISRLMHFANNPTSIEEVPKVVSDHLGMQSYPCLDLSSIGYKFAGVGPCHIPGNKAAHLIYKSTNPQAAAYNDTISLWIAPDDGSLNLAPNKVFRIRGPESDHPLITWRHNNLIYYMVGDSYPNVQKAYVTLNGENQGV